MGVIQEMTRPAEPWGLIVAGGLGIRLEQPIPKQFLGVGTRGERSETVLDLSLRTYEDCPDVKGIVLVYPIGHSALVVRIARRYTKIKALVEGGPVRQVSVMRGLAKIEGAFTIIQDAARPIVHEPALAECIERLQEGRRAVHTACHPYATMLLVANGRVVGTLDRDDVAHGQCPVGFRTDDLRRAFACACSHDREFRDELSLVRYAFPDIEVDVVEGHPSGFKLTYPEDMDLLRAYLRRRAEPVVRRAAGDVC
jgi:2-C-methyl-D-erythritol 4-phosphate cytidylyltransferase